MMIPYLCPELPDRAKGQRCTTSVKTPLVYTSVALRNWSRSRSSASRIYAPGRYFSSFA